MKILVIYAKKIKKYRVESVCQDAAKMKYTFSADANAKKVINK